MVHFGCDTGVVRVRHGHGGGTEDTRDMPAWSLKKMAVATKRASVAPKLIANINQRQSAQVGVWKANKRAPPCAWGFYEGINIILSIVVQTPLLFSQPFIYHDELPSPWPCKRPSHRPCKHPLKRLLIINTDVVICCRLVVAVGPFA